jgi:recombination protein RecR
MAQGIIENLIEKLTMLPGIGRKTAQRLSFHILAMPSEEAKSIASPINELKDRAGFCRLCFNITESEFCPICRDQKRDRKKICVVEEPSNIIVVEKSGGFNGLYHVLLGALAPLDGITPEKLKIAELIERVRTNGVEEVIIATNPNTKGEITAQYLKEALSPLNVNITRIAYGLPMGGDIEFADEVTLRKSMEGRRKL